MVGFCTLAGGASSHVAILARSLDIPAVAGIEPRALDIADGTLVILDGAKGTLRMNVTEDDVARIRSARSGSRPAGRGHARADEPAVTGDGHHVEVVANIGGLEDAEAMTKGAEGVGLLRSEFVFLGRKAPTEDEQAEIYTAIAKALAPGQPLVIRTWTSAATSRCPTADRSEENPFLGEQGIRVGLDRPEVLRTQVRDPPGGRRRREDQRDVPDDRHHRGLPAGQGDLRGGAGRPGVAPVPVGIMVEVPSVAVMAPQFAAEVDFFSVGTNDLTQYTPLDLAIPSWRRRWTAQPTAVLGLIAQAVKAAHEAGRWVGVCGGMASDPRPCRSWSGSAWTS